MIQLKNFVNLTKDELLSVLEWRNHPNVRKMMNDSKLIDPEEHLNFVTTLKKDQNNVYFKVDEIGVVYFNNLDSDLPELGLYSNLESRKKGKGTELMKVVLQLASEMSLSQLSLTVLDHNARAISLYKNFGFRIFYTDYGIVKMIKKI